MFYRLSYMLRIICTLPVAHLLQRVGCHLPGMEHIVVLKFSGAPLFYMPYHTFSFNFLVCSQPSVLESVTENMLCLVISLCLFVASFTNHMCTCKMYKYLQTILYNLVTKCTCRCTSALANNHHTFHLSVCELSVIKQTKCSENFRAVKDIQRTTGKLNGLNFVMFAALWKVTFPIGWWKAVGRFQAINIRRSPKHWSRLHLPAKLMYVNIQHSCNLPIF